MIDVSDGLAADLARLADASGVGARILLDAVPIASAATPQDALSGGEDYELLVTLPDDAAAAAAAHDLRERFAVPLTEIGEVVSDGLTLIEADGSERALESEGWDHFEEGRSGRLRGPGGPAGARLR